MVLGKKLFCFFSVKPHSILLEKRISFKIFFIQEVVYESIDHRR